MKAYGGEKEMANKAKIEGIIYAVVGMVIGVFLAAELLPIAFDSWFNASTGSWGSASAALWVIVPVIALIGFILLFFDFGIGE